MISATLLLSLAFNTGFPHAPHLRRTPVPPFHRASPLSMMSPAERLATVVRGLANDGASKEELETAFAAAIAVAYAPPPPPPPPVAASVGGLRPPATASDAQRAFREAYRGRLTTATTQKFLNAVIEDRSVILRFEYSRAYAVGLCALCDAFLPKTCIDAADAIATFDALCFGLGLDASTVRADADALCSVAAGVQSADQLLATDEFAAIAGSPSFRYTYTFGVGLVKLMKAVGEVQLTAPGRGYATTSTGGARGDGAIDRWCAALNLSKYVNTLTQDTDRPLVVENVGRFSFDAPDGIEPPRKDLDLSARS